MFEVVQSQKRPQRWQITGAMDELNKCEVEAHSNVWRQMLSACGFVFAAEWWSIQNEGLRVAEVIKNTKIFFEKKYFRFFRRKQFVKRIRCVWNGQSRYITY